MSIALQLLSGLTGAAGGWLVSRIVDRFTAPGWPGVPSTMVASGLLLLSLSIKFGSPGPFMFVYSGLGLVLIAVTVFDIRRHEIPHIVTIPGMIAGLALGTFVLPLGFTGSAMGLIAGGGVLLLATVVEALRKKEIGGGDWKYAAMIGSFIGWEKIVMALVFTGIIGLFGALALHAAGSSARPQALGPWLSAGAVASILLT